MSGIPVLITLDDVGPIAGRLLVEWRDVDHVDLLQTSDRVETVGAWRIELDEVPQRHLYTVARLVKYLGRAVEVRVWGRPEAAHYVGRAYVEAGDVPLQGGQRPFTVFGQGALTRAQR